MRSGRLKHPVTIKELIATPDGMGGQVLTWTIFANTRADIKPVSAAEQTKNMAVENTVTHNIIMRYRNGITTSMRAFYGIREFEILSVINVKEANVQLDLICTELLS